MNWKLFISLCLTIKVSSANQLRFFNNCPFPVWPGILAGRNEEIPADGGFRLNSLQSRVITTPDSWMNGRIWPRTGCDDSGKCETGDCGNRFRCGGSGWTPPVTLAEMTFNDPLKPGMDFYHISLVDGFNVPMEIKPTGGFKSKGRDPFDCIPTGCAVRLNSRCPSELRQYDRDGATIACKSACIALKTDQYCCRGAYNTTRTCNSHDWPHNYPRLFKDSCPEAHSYAYDDHKKTFSCRRTSSPTYDIIFCP